MNGRRSIISTAFAGVLAVAAAVRYRSENTRAGGSGVITSPTTLDLYGGAAADHRVSIVLVVAAVVAMSASLAGRRHAA